VFLAGISINVGDWRLTSRLQNPCGLSASGRLTCELKEIALLVLLSAGRDAKTNLP